MTDGALLAVSDLHVSYAENRRIVDGLRPASPDDWLLVAGDVGELLDSVEATLRLLRGRFAKVIWAPGNHELWTHPRDPVTLRGEQRYAALVEACRDLGVAVIAPSCGYYADQGPVLGYQHDEDHFDADSLAAAVRQAHAGRPARAIGVDERRRQRAQVAAAHARVYDSVMGGGR